MTGSTPARRSGALGWPTRRPDAVATETQPGSGRPSGVGWPAPLPPAPQAGPPDVRSDGGDEAVADDAKGAATRSGAPSLEVSQQRIRTVLDGAVVSRETDGIPASLADAGMDT